MALYALSDTHLSTAIEKPMDIFGSRWKDHTQKICDRWNKLITDEDTVVIGGDISWALTPDEAAGDLKFLDSLTGRKILLKGNHDYWWTTLKKLDELFKRESITTIEVMQNNSVVRDGFAICGTRGWYSDPESNPNNNCDHKKIVAREVMRLRMSLDSAKDAEGERIVFTHFPPVMSDYIFRELIDVMHEYGVKRCYYGHIHGNYTLPPCTEFEGIRFSIVSADYLDFYPKPIRHENI